jgi:hypothetical protein
MVTDRFTQGDGVHPIRPLHQDGAVFADLRCDLWRLPSGGNKKGNEFDIHSFASHDHKRHLHCGTRGPAPLLETPPLAYRPVPAATSQSLRYRSDSIHRCSSHRIAPARAAWIHSPSEICYRVSSPAASSVYRSVVIEVEDMRFTVRRVSTIQLQRVFIRNQNARVRLANL